MEICGIATVENVQGKVIIRLGIDTLIPNILVLINLQETQLSQRGRAMLRVIEYVAKSLMFIQNTSLNRVCVSSYLYSFVIVCILYRFCDIQRQIMA